MYHKSFEVDDGRNVWNSGLWIRYKIFEEAIRDAPTIDAVPVGQVLRDSIRLEEEGIAETSDSKKSAKTGSAGSCYLPVQQRQSFS